MLLLLLLHHDHRKLWLLHRMQFQRASEEPDAVRRPSTLPHLRDELDELQANFDDNEVRLENAIDAVRLAPALLGGVAAVLFGPSKLPELGKSLGKTVKSFQAAASVSPPHPTPNRDNPTFSLS